MTEESMPLAELLDGRGVERRVQPNEKQARLGEELRLAFLDAGRREQTPGVGLLGGQIISDRAGATELQLQPAVEIDPNGAVTRFTRWRFHALRLTLR